jgi:hypothetical protein
MQKNPKYTHYSILEEFASLKKIFGNLCKKGVLDESLEGYTKCLKIIDNIEGVGKKQCCSCFLEEKQFHSLNCGHDVCGNCLHINGMRSESSPLFLKIKCQQCNTMTYLS